ncbi:MAG: hypothetical protein ACXVCI_17600 [Bdellovibrionota bacterium]
MKLLTVLLCLFSFSAFAEGEAFTELSKAVSKKTVERMSTPKLSADMVIKGNQTGGSCKVASDCIVGIKTGEKDVTCISAKEGVPATQAGPGGLKCTCLTSIFACGYAFPK